MKKALNEPLTAKRALMAIGAVCIAGLVVYGGYRAVAALLLQREVKQAIPKVLSELRQQREIVVNCVEAYRSAFGYYPPSGHGSEPGVVNALYYELCGTRFHPDQQSFHVIEMKEGVTEDTLEKVLGMRSFSNTMAMPLWPTNFLTGKPLSHREIESGIYGLSFFNEVLSEKAGEAFEISSWRYTREQSSHNPGKYDLWIEVSVGPQHFVVGNWRDAQ